MCAICGIINFDGRPVAEPDLVRMRDIMVNRGPDHGGLWRNGSAGLGHRRLKILDLSPNGNQPMPNEDKSVWVVLNGEIYNFPELRPQLEACGHRFRSTSDTEVLVHGYEEWGEDLIPKLDGMFAIGIWDTRRQQLLLARDRFGKKPLYYMQKAQTLLFASDIKAFWTLPNIQLSINFPAIDCYLHHLGVTQRHAIFKEISKIQPAHYTVFNQHGSRTVRYWQQSFAGKLNLSEAEWLEQIEAALQAAVKRRLMSDVPLGAFLSGGVDSSLVVAFMSKVTNRPVKTFSIGFQEQDYSELKFARLVAQQYQSEHEEIMLQPEVISILPSLVWEYGEPFADSSAIPTFYVSQAARRFVTVALSGDGGDEMFGGYDIARAAWHAWQYDRFLPRFIRQPLEKFLLNHPLPDRNRWLHKLKTLAVHASDDPAIRHSYSMAFGPAQRQRLYTPAFSAALQGQPAREVYELCRPALTGLNLVDQHLLLTILTRLPNDYLVKVDVASMKVALEVRSPFLDTALAELSGAMPPEIKVRGGRQKYLLKKLAERHLPRQVIYRRKRGFALPLEHWLRRDLAPLLRQLLPDGRLVQNDWFNKAEISRLISEHHNSTADHTHRLWALLWLELWHRMFIDRTLKPTDSLSEP